MNAKEIVAKVTNLPVLPANTVKLLQLLENPHENTQAALEIIQNDPVLSAKLLRICNSAAIGLREPVASVDNAVFFLGFSEVQRLAIALSFGGSLKRTVKPDDTEARDLWHHSVVTAHAAAFIATERNMEVHPSVAFTAGLMHDLGKLVIQEAFPADQLATMRGAVEAGRQRCEVERELFGADHAAVGAALLEAWRMPAVLLEPVANHHEPVCKPDPALSALIHIADCVVHQIDAKLAWKGFAAMVNKNAVAALAFVAKRLTDTLEALEGQKDKVAQFAMAA
jgi:putative nucleotidyltransferase with HDIG domain